MSMVNGLLEVYDEFPWVYEDDAGESYALLTYYSYDYRDALTGRKHKARGRTQGDYINPQYICSAYDGTLYDKHDAEYHYCEILMASGAKYYLDDWWCRRDLLSKNEEMEEIDNGRM